MARFQLDNFISLVDTYIARRPLVVKEVDVRASSNLMVATPSGGMVGASQATLDERSRRQIGGLLSGKQSQLRQASLILSHGARTLAAASEVKRRYSDDLIQLSRYWTLTISADQPTRSAHIATRQLVVTYAIGHC
jgi:hypothetical protein